MDNSGFRNDADNTERLPGDTKNVHPEKNNVELAKVVLHELTEKLHLNKGLHEDISVKKISEEFEKDEFDQDEGISLYLFLKSNLHVTFS